jgi:hypothetical protein
VSLTYKSGRKHYLSPLVPALPRHRLVLSSRPSSNANDAARYRRLPPNPLTRKCHHIGAKIAAAVEYRMMYTMTLDINIEMSTLP